MPLRSLNHYRDMRDKNAHEDSVLGAAYAGLSEDLQAFSFTIERTKTQQITRTESLPMSSLRTSSHASSETSPAPQRSMLNLSSGHYFLCKWDPVDTSAAGNPGRQTTVIALAPVLADPRTPPRIMDIGDRVAIRDYNPGAATGFKSVIDSLPKDPQHHKYLLIVGKPDAWVCRIRVSMHTELPSVSLKSSSVSYAAHSTF